MLFGGVHPPDGALVEHSADEIKTVFRLPGLEPRVRCPTQTIGGPPEQIDAIAARAESEASSPASCRPRRHSHTQQMDPLLGESFSPPRSRASSRTHAADGILLDGTRVS